MSDTAGSTALPDVLQKVVDDVARRSGITNPKCNVESASGAGDGYTSTVFRVRIEDQNGKALSFIVKASSSALGGLMDAIFAREGFTYSSILPQLKEVAHMQNPLPWPDCLSMKVDGERPYTVALADLRTEGYTMADRTRPLDEAHCREALRQLARLHGASMSLEHLRPQEFRNLREKVPNLFDHPESKKFFDSMRNAFLAVPSMIADTYPEGSEVNLKLKNFFSRFASNITQLMFVDPEGGNSFLHGDCHLNNMLFQVKESGHVTGCRLYDFQTVRYGAPATDLATLLLSSTEKSLRDACWDSLLREYHKELQATLTTAGCKDPDAVYSWARCKDQLRRGCLYGLFMTPMYLHAYLADSETVQQFRENLGHREESSESLPESSAPTEVMFKPSEVFKKRLSGVVESFVNRGWLPTVSEAESLLFLTQ